MVLFVSLVILMKFFAFMLRVFLLMVLFVMSSMLLWMLLMMMSFLFIFLKLIINILILLQILINLLFKRNTLLLFLILIRINHEQSRIIISLSEWFDPQLLHLVSERLSQGVSMLCLWLIVVAVEVILKQVRILWLGGRC